jgi:peptide/nickel transport system permease protein
MDIFSPRILRGFLEVVKRYWKIKLGLAIFIVLLGLSLLQPLIDYCRFGGKDAIEIGAFEGFLRNSWEHPLGTDYLGRDFFSMLLVGIRLSLYISFIAASIGSLIAISIGFIAAYKGGIIDDILRSVIDAVLVIPTWPIFAIIVAYVKFLSIHDLGFALAIFIWPWTARVLRAQALSLRERPFVDLAKVTGESDLEIIFKELIPNILPYILMGFSSQMMLAILTETGLRLIGLGPPLLPTLGYLLQHCMTYGYTTLRPYLVIAVVLTLILIFIALNFINLGLEEESNPRLKKITGL